MERLIKEEKEALQIIFETSLGDEIKYHNIPAEVYVSLIQKEFIEMVEKPGNESFVFLTKKGEELVESFFN